MSSWKKVKDALTGASVEGSVRDLGMASEQITLDQILGLADLVTTITEKLVEVAKLYCASAYDSMDEAAAEMDQLESKADGLRRDILEGLSARGFIPISRVDLFRLTTGLDQIANYATGAADRIVMRRFDLPEDVNLLLEEMAETDLRAVRKLRDAIMTMRTNMAEAAEMSDEVGRIESEVDEIYVKIYTILFEMDTDFKTFHQLKTIIERLEEVADKAADNAETLRLIAIRHLEVE
jgi:predicted phosphate transport protein (TIGR00153 family)